MNNSSPGEAKAPQHVTTEADLDSFLDDHDVALLMLYTDGCTICASMEPVVSNVARETGIAVVRVNPRNDPPLIDRFDVRSVPQFVLFVDQKPVARRADGFVPGDDLAAWIEAHTD